jgi:hypothetical protein
VADGLKLDLELQLKVSCFRSNEIGVKTKVYHAKVRLKFMASC